MSGPIPERFVLRKNLDGSFDAICTSCFLTIATAPSALALETAQRAHACTAALSIKSRPRIPPSAVHASKARLA